MVDTLIHYFGVGGYYILFLRGLHGYASPTKLIVHGGTFPFEYWHGNIDPKLKYACKVVLKSVSNFVCSVGFLGTGTKELVMGGNFSIGK